MHDTYSAVANEAGALLTAWQDGQFTDRIARRMSRVTEEPSVFERERQELLQGVVAQMGEAVRRNDRDVRNAGSDPKIEACLSILRHLGASRRP